MGISSSRNNREEEAIQDMNLEIGFNTNCPIRDTFFYSHVESLSRCERNITGFRANSASPSDIYKIELNDENGNISQNVIMKLFLVNDPFAFLKNPVGNIDFTVRTTLNTPGLPDIVTPDYNINVPLARVNYEAQVYELVVYLEKIKKLTDYNLCPYFVKVLGGNINLSIIDIWNYLFVLPDGTIRNGININNFMRNIIIMRFSHIFSINGNRIDGRYNVDVQGRPAINDNNNNIQVVLSTYPRNETGNILALRLPGLGIINDPTVRYSETNQIIYNINPGNMFDSLKCGYILTEEITNMSLMQVSNLIKIIDIPFNGFAPPNNTIYRKLRSIEDGLNAFTIDQGNFNNLIQDMRTIADGIENNLGLRNIVSSSKIRNVIDEIFNLGNVFFAVQTPANRTNLLNKVIEIRRLSINPRTDNSNIGIRLIREAVFQVLIACYSMYLSGVAHNDLHTGNVFLEIFDTPNVFNYVINEQLYVINTICKPKIYDFDRSYVVNYDNELLNNNNASQNNILINPKDFIKVICYIRTINISPQINEYLAQVINDPRPDPVVRIALLDTFYIAPNCFLQRANPDRTLRSANTQDDFNGVYRYGELVRRFGNSLGYFRNNINEVPYNNNLETYVLDRRIFDAQGNFEKNRYFRLLFYLSRRFGA